MSSHELTIEVADLTAARSIADLLGDLAVPEADAVSMFDQKATSTEAADNSSGDANVLLSERGRWTVTAYYQEPPDPDAIAAALADIDGLGAVELQISPLAQENWVAVSQAALPPVEAGRFLVHGSHDRARAATAFYAIEIDAGEAFGTAHHATTLGCLLAADRLTRQRAFKSVLDLGCGSGLLAIAAAKALPHARVLASDIDPQAVRVATANFRLNGVAQRIDALTASGMGHPRLNRPGQFDLVFANILAGPLVILARPIARVTAPGGVAILSGLLSHQAREVGAAYRAAGFAMVENKQLEGWSTLTLVRAGG